MSDNKTKAELITELETCKKENRDLRKALADLKETEGSFERYFKYLRRWFEAVPNGVVILDSQMKFIFVNRAFLTVVERQAGDFLRKRLDELDPPIMTAESTKILAERQKERYLSGQPLLNDKIELVSFNGQKKRITYSVGIVKGEKDITIGEVFILNNVIDL